MPILIAATARPSPVSTNLPSGPVCHGSQLGMGAPLPLSADGSDPRFDIVEVRSIRLRDDPGISPYRPADGSAWIYRTRSGATFLQLRDTSVDYVKRRLPETRAADRAFVPGGTRIVRVSRPEADAILDASPNVGSVSRCELVESAADEAARH